MTNRTDSVQGEGGDGVTPPPPPGANDHLQSRANNKVYKSGPLFISSKGIGWTSWKKRWFILTRTSLVFFRSDPNTIPLKGSEVNLTLGGIDLNSSGSVVVKEDKKLLTVLFADGRDGRTFTLKAETLEDLHEWRAALEEALANAPSAALVMGQNGIFKNDQTNATDVSADQTKDRMPSMVIGRPILLALEDIDGSPSFLEKALRFVEEHGVKVEGILRQAADVDDVEHRIRVYEEGKSEFSPDEDAHVIADCVKYVLRELPSSPVPASCCNALLEAYRTERSMRVSAMRTAICETFPEPNRRLLQRILLMMQSVASHKNETRMSISGVAACMAPLLLRPLLAGECELQHNFDMGGDGSVQLLQAAAAANLAQAIVITLLEEYDNIFGEGSMSAELYSESEDSGSESEELTDDDEAFEDDEEDYTTDGSEVDIDDEIANASNASFESDETRDESRSQASHQSHSGLDPPLGDTDDDQRIQTSSESSLQRVGLHQESMKGCEGVCNRTDQDISEHIVSGAIVDVENTETSTSHNSDTSKGTARGDRRSTTVWGRTTGKKNLSMESIDLPLDEEDEIKRLQATKTDLQNRIAHESKENTRLQDCLETRKNTLQERRVALQNEVTRLQEQLEKERELRAALEDGLRTPQGKLVVSSAMDKKTKTNLEEIAQAESDIAGLKQKADDLEMQLNQQREQNSRFQKEHNLPSPKDKSKVNVDHKNVDAADSREKLVGSKNDNLLDNDKKQEAVLLTSEISHQNQPTGQSKSDKSLPEDGPGRPSSNSTKRSASRGEGTNLTSSALSKLSNRLNFLKERRAQMTNELQGMEDKSRSSDQQPTQNPPAGETPEARQLQHNVDKCQSKPSESNKGSGSQRQQTNVSVDNNTTDKARKPDGNPNLDREKAKSIPSAEKGQATTKRTNSR